MALVGRVVAIGRDSMVGGPLTIIQEEGKVTEYLVVMGLEWGWGVTVLMFCEDPFRKCYKT